MRLTSAKDALEEAAMSMQHAYNNLGNVDAIMVTLAMDSIVLVSAICVALQGMYL